MSELEALRRISPYIVENRINSALEAEANVADEANKDPLEEVDLGEEGDKRPTFISANIDQELKSEVILLLKEFKDCFAWDFNEISGLSRELVELKLPIQARKKPVKQTPRRFAPAVMSKIKEEVEQLLKSKFIRSARYVEWLANIVPVMKKNGKLRVCIDFRDMNAATPKDEYAMPIVEMLIDYAAGFEYLSMLDGYAGYNQIFIAEEDVPKTVFRCPGALGTYEWVVMSFGLKNPGATYQRVMNSMFHDFIENFMQVYIDDIAGHFLSFVVHKKGIEVNQSKTKAIMDVKPPSTKKELLSLLGNVNFLRRFISNLSGKTKAFSPLLRLKNEDFIWKKEHQEAFDEIKEYLTKPPILAPHVRNRPMSRIGKWELALTEYSLTYAPLKAMKGQVVAHFLVDHSIMVAVPQNYVDLVLWKLYFDGSSHKNGTGIGRVIISPDGIPVKCKYSIDGMCTNNEAEYESLITGLELLIELGARNVEIMGDSKLVVKQVSKEYRYVKENLIMYFVIVNRLLKLFDSTSIRHIPRRENQEDNDLAQEAPGYKKGENEEPVQVRKKVRATLLSPSNLCVIKLGAVDTENFEIVMVDNGQENDWCKPLIEYLRNPTGSTDRKIKYRALNFVLMGNELFKKTVEGVLLKFLGESEAYLAMSNVRSGTCGAHQAGHKMKWTLMRSGVY
ncbi:uncharacterized protein LOC131639897 [Vicia villosa]|uniref:uncharacterized protein LOC131639897 n=1 Tax=Vicia villosa TaxID=3911 RepID=UPI00273AFA69|nr:uncharacterized protein LOC131639897 [Vicia villosa]